MLVKENATLDSRSVKPEAGKCALIAVRTAIFGGVI